MENFTKIQKLLGTLSDDATEVNKPQLSNRQIDILSKLLPDKFEFGTYTFIFHPDTVKSKATTLVSDIFILGTDKLCYGATITSDEIETATWKLSDVKSLMLSSHREYSELTVYYSSAFQGAWTMRFANFSDCLLMRDMLKLDWHGGR